MLSKSVDSNSYIIDYGPLTSATIIKKHFDINGKYVFNYENLSISKNVLIANFSQLVIICQQYKYEKRDKLKDTFETISNSFQFVDNGILWKFTLLSCGYKLESDNLSCYYDNDNFVIYVNYTFDMVELQHIDKWKCTIYDGTIDVESLLLKYRINLDDNCYYLEYKLDTEYYIIKYNFPEQYSSRNFIFDTGMKFIHQYCHGFDKTINISNIYIKTHSVTDILNLVGNNFIFYEFGPKFINIIQQHL